MQIIASLLANEAAKAAVVTYMEERAARGLRALGVATSADEGASWQLLGLISLLDPPREDTQETVRQANDLGVEVSLRARLAWQMYPCVSPMDGVGRRDDDDGDENDDDRWKYGLAQASKLDR